MDSRSFILFSVMYDVSAFSYYKSYSKCLAENRSYQIILCGHARNIFLLTIITPALLEVDQNFPSRISDRLYLYKIEIMNQRYS